MTALLYLKFLQFKNGIKQLRYEKSKLFFVIFIAVAAVVSFIPAFLGVNTPDSHASPLHNSRATLLFIILVYLLLYIFVAQSWWAGTQKATLIFRMSDVQFVFTAPLKPQSVLMYGMLNKFQMIMLSSIFIFFQYPNVRHAGLSFGSFLLCILIFLIATFAGSCTGMLIYAASYRNVRIKNFFKTLLLAVMLLIIAIILKAYAVTHDPMEAVRIAFENPVIRFLPIVGWALEIIKGFIGEFGTAAIVSSLLLPGLIAATLKILYSIDINFYEDAISAIGKYEKTIENKKNGKSTIDFKKTSAGKFGIGRGWGESAIMYRMLKSMKREVSNLASMSTIAVLISAGVAIAVIKISGISGAGGLGIGVIILLYVSAIYSQYSAFTDELKSDYFFTIPGSNTKKLIFASLPIVMKSSLEFLIAIAGFAIAAGATVGSAIGAFISLIGFSFVLTGSQLICYRVLRTDSGVLFSLFSLIMNVLLLLPGIIIIAVLYPVRKIPYFEIFSIEGVLIVFFTLIVNMGLYFACLKPGENMLRFGKDA